MTGNGNGSRRPSERRSRETTPIFEADRDLLEGVEDDLAEFLSSSVHVEFVDIGRNGSLPTFAGADEAAAELRLLILEGVLLRTVAVGDRVVVDLCLAGDPVYPWSLGSVFSSVPSTCTWQVIERARLALLDRRFFERVNATPQVTRALDLRARRCADKQLLMRAIAADSVDAQLRAVLWLLSDQLGKVTPAGQTLPIKLTHPTLAALLCVHRCSVTSALGRLREAGEIIDRPEGGWLLRGGSSE